LVPAVVAEPAVERLDERVVDGVVWPIELQRDDTLMGHT
jgi:hypothetical protein